MLNALPVVSAVRQPRSVIKLNGTPVPLISWEVDTATFYQADTFRCSLPLSGMPPGFGIDLLGTSPKIEVEVFCGFPADPETFTADDLTSIFFGRVDDVDLALGVNTISLSGRDLAGLLIDEKSSQKFTNQTASQVATTLAQKYGLTPVVTATTGTVGRLYQIDHVRLQDEKSPWDLLTWLAKEVDFVVYVKGRELHFEPRPTTPTNPYVFQWTPAGEQAAPSFNGQRIGLSRSLTLAKDIKVTVRSWHSKKKKAFTAIATRGRKGSTEVQEYSLTIPGLSQDQAQQRAQAYLEELSRHEMKIAVDGPADNLLGKADVIQLQGTGSAWDQAYFPSSVSRSFEVGSGYGWHVDAKNHNTTSEPTI